MIKLFLILFAIILSAYNVNNTQQVYLKIIETSLVQDNLIIILSSTIEEEHHLNIEVNGFNIVSCETEEKNRFVIDFGQIKNQTLKIVQYYKNEDYITSLYCIDCNIMQLEDIGHYIFNSYLQPLDSTVIYEDNTYINIQYKPKNIILNSSYSFSLAHLAKLDINNDQIKISMKIFLPYGVLGPYLKYDGSSYCVDLIVVDQSFRLSENKLYNYSDFIITNTASSKTFISNDLVLPKLLCFDEIMFTINFKYQDWEYYFNAIVSFDKKNIGNFGCFDLWISEP